MSHYIPDFRNRYGLNQYGHYYSGHHYSPAYRHYGYHGYQRCYGLGHSYYRPYYYPRYYDDYAGFGLGIYAAPYQNAGVIYTDTVVVEPAIVEETYYTSPSVGTTIVQPYGPPAPEPIAPAAPTDEESADQKDGAADTVESPAPGLVEKGNEAFRAGRYDEARGWHARAMLADGEDGYAKLFYGLANFALGEFEVAASAIRRALMEAPELIDFPIDLRTIYDDSSVLTNQMQTLTRFRGQHSDDNELTFLLGYMYYATGDPQGAVSTLGDLTSGQTEDTLARLVRDAAIRVLPGDTPTAPSGATNKS